MNQPVPVRPWAAALAVLSAGLLGALASQASPVLATVVALVCATLTLGVLREAAADACAGPDESTHVDATPAPARYDELTGLPLRTLLEQECQALIAASADAGRSLALLYVDLDRMKVINSALGHAAGDAVIRATALRLRAAAPDALLGRLDGDEFVLLLPAVDEAQELADAMAGIFASAARPVLHESNEIAVSFSVGVACYPVHGDSFTLLCKRADAAAVQAKDAGRNTWREYDAAMPVAGSESMQLLTDLHRAMARGEFELHYQPQVELDSEQVVGAEALIRWRHPELGLLLPGRFIGLAEESGLIVPLGGWVLQEACRQAAAWRAEGLPPLVMAVNLSAAQFRQGDFVSSVLDALADAGLPPDCLELELTESMLIRDTDNVLEQVRLLKSRGVKLSIDDFGTGYSSLSYLKKFAVDKIKIDRSFVQHLATDPDDAAIVRAIVQMARGLNLRTIAEGAEDARTVEHLRLHRCDEVQGYHYGRPMPAHSFAQFLRSASAAGHTAR